MLHKRGRLGVLRTPSLPRLNNERLKPSAPLLAERLADRLATWGRPAITDYELGVLLCAECSSAAVELDLALYRTVVEQLGSFRLVTPRKDFKVGAVFQLFGHANSMPMEVACAVDPFAYVTHLSAMEFHGITDRFPKILYLTTPPDKEWRARAEEKMRKDLGDQYEAYRLARLPSLRFVSMERVDGARVELLRRSNRGAFKIIKSPAVRVATIGRTFLDMVREPECCGGMQHVVDTYRQYGPRNLPLIVEEVERHGKPIEKVRAGYLLEEVCKLQHELVNKWRAAVQRGGSRVLDPASEYSAIYSEAWKLSINVPSLQPVDPEEESAP